MFDNKVPGFVLGFVAWCCAGFALVFVAKRLFLVPVEPSFASVVAGMVLFFVAALAIRVGTRR